jgi:hypothetical protein
MSPMSDERNNVIPLPPQSRRFNADPSVDLQYIPPGEPLEGLRPFGALAEYVEPRRRIDTAVMV